MQQHTLFPVDVSDAALAARRDHVAGIEGKYAVVPGQVGVR